MRCVAINASNGRQCKRYALAGADLCLMHAPPSEAQAKAKAKLRHGSPKNDPLPRPEVTAVTDQMTATEAILPAALKGDDGHIIPQDSDILEQYAEDKVEAIELKKIKPRTKAVQDRLDTVIKRRDSNRDRLGLGGPATRPFDTPEERLRVARAKQGAQPVRTEARARLVAQLLHDAHALPPIEDDPPQAENGESQ